MPTLAAMLGNPNAGDVLPIKYQAGIWITVAEATVIAVASPDDITVDLRIKSAVSLLATIVGVAIPTGRTRVQLVKQGNSITALDNGGGTFGTVSIQVETATRIDADYDANMDYGFDANRAGGRTTVQFRGVPHNPAVRIG